MQPTIKQTVYPSFKELNMLEELEEEIREELGIDFFDSIGITFDYWPEDDNAEYPHEGMPIDMVLLGMTSIPDSYFGFITEFSTIDNLANAPIIQYESIGLDKHAILIAHNFIDFLRLLVTTKSVFEFISEDDDSSEDTIGPEREYIYKRIMEKFQIEPFESVRAYKQKLIEDRENSVVAKTYNGLGVKAVSDSMTHSTFIVNEGDDETIKGQLTSFLISASLESKLAYIRDVQEYDYTEIPSFEETDELLIAELERYGFVNEVKRMTQKFVG
ncbi:hypothetical protein [Paenibacillus mendelii]|uniref:Knr4/Smi1-like domain-containing protein n=1 Tax=Paenibacillus mendelii TaxID=206163 RepID=A0ABV6J8U2_9BACL|nr:hypothetical protein [Paenibacillus mendelii]MCQ6559555.1 hypothetical protein [Paenibacillus mendelii]